MSEEKFLKEIHQLTKEEISERGLSHDSLWLLQVNLETQGPYLADDLRSISDKYADELAKCMACNLKQKNWKPFFEHGPFQKRQSEAPRPVIKAEEKGRHSFHLLIEGQKKGPLSVSKINEAIDNGEIKMTNLISADGGKSWRKIYHFPQFDRRKDAALDLEISKPDEDHFEKSRVYSTQVLKKLNLKKEEESLEKALLACQQHLNKKGDSTRKVSMSDLGKAPSASEKFDDVFSKFSFTPKTGKNFAIAALVILVVALFVFDEDKKAPVQKTSKSKTIKKDRSRETASRAKPAAPRKRSKYSSRDRTRRRQENLDNSDLEYNESNSRYRDKRADRVEDEPPQRDRSRGRSRNRNADVVDDVEDDFIDAPEDEEIALDPADNMDMLDREGRSLALDEEIDEEYEPREEFLDEGIEDIDY